MPMINKTLNVQIPEPTTEITKKITFTNPAEIESRCNTPVYHELLLKTQTEDVCFFSARRLIKS